jgi:hypothetical protein
MWSGGEAHGMNGWIDITGKDWFDLLSRPPGMGEVNFRQPGGKTLSRGLKRGEPFLFKLHAPRHCGGVAGLFAYSTIMPLRFAWALRG